MDTPAPPPRYPTDYRRLLVERVADHVDALKPLLPHVGGWDHYSEKAENPAVSDTEVEVVCLSLAAARAPEKWARTPKTMTGVLASRKESIEEEQRVLDKIRGLVEEEPK